jgi:hypothetical protein
MKARATILHMRYAKKALRYIWSNLAEKRASTVPANVPKMHITNQSHVKANRNMQACTYVCVCVCMYVCMYTYIRSNGIKVYQNRSKPHYVNNYMYVCMYVCMYVYYVCMCKNVYMHIHMTSLLIFSHCDKPTIKMISSCEEP